MSFLALPFLAAALGTLPAPMMCYGAEPFWSLTIRAEGACSDSDSDTPPRFGVILDGPEMLLRGCCEPEG